MASVSRFLTGRLKLKVNEDGLNPLKELRSNT